MTRPSHLALAAAGTLALGLLAAGLASPGPRAAAQPAPAGVGVALLAAPNAAQVVDAADAFLAALSDKQRAVAQVELTPQLAARWSNFPVGVVERNGVYFRDLTPEQAEAALKVARLALGDEGFARFQEVRASDDQFAQGKGGKGGPGGPGGKKDGKFDKKDGGGKDKKGGPGGGGGPSFGSPNYMIAFLGRPSKADPWLLQVGGHHLAFNIYYKGAAGAATPYHVAAQPTVWKDAQGATHDPLAPMRDSLRDLLAALTPEQLKRAKLDARFNDVYAGPGKDGKFPAKSEGVPLGELSDTAKGFVKKAIMAWTGDTAQGAEYRKLYEADLDKIKVSFSGTPNVGNAAGDYVRLDGPRVWIEFATQGNDHYHTIWRDRLADYGAEFTR